MLPAEGSEAAAATRAAVLALRRDSGLPIAGAAWVVGPQLLRIIETSGARLLGRRGFPVKAGTGLLGKVLATGRPAAVSDHRPTRSLTHEHDSVAAAEEVRALLAVPVVVGATVRAVLFAGSCDAVRLGDRALSAGADAARDLEQWLAAHEQARRLLMERRTERDDPAHHGEAVWKRVHEAHTELSDLVATLDDGRLKERFREVCSSLASGCCSEQPAPEPAVARLSPREVDVLAAVAAGCTNLDIAERLDIGLESVKGYLRSVMRKLGAGTRLEAVIAARRAGLLPSSHAGRMP
jgi:DNA-binding NarL/FixJ family response regulator